MQLAVPLYAQYVLNIGVRLANRLFVIVVLRCVQAVAGHFIGKNSVFVVKDESLYAPLAPKHAMLVLASHVSSV